MKYLERLRSLILTLLAAFAFSCQNQDLTDPIEESASILQADSGILKTGEKLDIPYTTKNMDKAFKQVLLHLNKESPYGKSHFAVKSSFASKLATAKNIEIVPSHYYFRFLPKDSTQYNILVNDSIMDVTNIPMHFNVLEEGDVYDDPDIIGDETGETFGWQYAVLPYDYSFPNHIEHELLEDMYFTPEMDEDESLAKGEMPWMPILALSAEIKVGRLNSGGGELRSDQIYGLVTHEMTHASHYRLERALFVNPRSAGCTLQTMAESWAEGVETVITNDRYLELKPNYAATDAFNLFATDDRRLYNSLRQNQIVEHGSKEEYTPIVIDLVDDFNQQVEIPRTVLRPIDRVHGYNLRQIQTSLKNARGPHGWKENLISDHFNATEGFLEELFDVYMYDNCN